MRTIVKLPDKRNSKRDVFAELTEGIAARAMLDDNKHVQYSERRSDRHEEVAGEDRLGMVLQEGGPALIAARLAWWSLRHVIANRPRSDPDPELDQQLIANPLLAP